METLNELHQRYDGPVPEHKLAILAHGGTLELELARARGNQAQARVGVARAVAGIRITREDMRSGGYDYLTPAKRAEVWAARRAYLRDWWKDYVRWTAYRRKVERLIAERDMS